VPANPGAWLMALAKRRAIDAFRRDTMRERKHEEIARTLDETFDGALEAIEAIEAAMDDDLGDELLGLIFTACHPILSPNARAALTLRVVGPLRGWRWWSRRSSPRSGTDRAIEGQEQIRVRHSSPCVQPRRGDIVKPGA